MAVCEDFPHDLGCAGHASQGAIKPGLDLEEVGKAVDGVGPGGKSFPPVGSEILRAEKSAGPTQRHSVSIN